MCNDLPHMELIKKLQTIDMEEPLGKNFIIERKQWWTSSVLSQRERSNITVVAIHGHEKIATKCADAPPKKGGRPSANGKKREATILQWQP